MWAVPSASKFIAFREHLAAMAICRGWCTTCRPWRSMAREAARRRGVSGASPAQLCQLTRHFGDGEGKDHLLVAVCAAVSCPHAG